MKKGFLGLEITVSKIRYTFITRKGKTLQIYTSGSVPFNTKYNSPKDLTDKVREILEENRLKPERVFVTVTRADTLIRQLNMPSMKTSELEEVISSEIEKIPSFFANKFDFIFHAFRVSRDTINVVYAAVHNNILKFVLEGLQKARVNFRHLEIAPLNLQNLYLGGPSAEPRVSLVVNDAISYLVVYKDNQYKLFYKTALGLDQLYPNKNNTIDERGLQSFVAELKRVFKAYQTDHKEEELNKISLIWDNQGSQFLDQHLQEHLGMTVQPPSLEQIPGTKWQFEPVL